MATTFPKSFTSRSLFREEALEGRKRSLDTILSSALGQNRPIEIADRLIGWSTGRIDRRTRDSEKRREIRKILLKSDEM
jgi:hypothetical protein